MSLTFVTAEVIPDRARPTLVKLSMLAGYGPDKAIQAIITHYKTENSNASVIVLVRNHRQVDAAVYAAESLHFLTTIV